MEILRKALDEMAKMTSIVVIDLPPGIDLSYCVVSKSLNGKRYCRTLREPKKEGPVPEIVVKIRFLQGYNKFKVEIDGEGEKVLKFRSLCVYEDNIGFDELKEAFESEIKDIFWAYFERVVDFDLF